MNVRRTALPTEEQTPEEYLTETLKRDDLVDGEAIQVGVFRLCGFYRSYRREKGSRKIAVLYKDGGVYVFNGEVDKPESPEQFEQQFIDMVSSTCSMTADDLRLINNNSYTLLWRILVIPTPSWRAPCRLGKTLNNCCA